jgi:hypothetical protein
VKKGTGLIKINGSPLGLVAPEALKLKVYEPILILGWEKFANVRLYSILLYCCRVSCLCRLACLFDVTII